MAEKPQKHIKTERTVNTGGKLFYGRLKNTTWKQLQRRYDN